MASAAGCGRLGPAAIGSGRQHYNAVINATEDEQLLSMIVRERYDESSGMLAVISVTAQLKISATVGADVGLGPRNTYEGNLVPLSGAIAYEESPTIAYVPLRGERFVARMLAPISIEQVLLLSRAATSEFDPLRLLIRRINGIDNPLFVATPRRPGFSRIITLIGLLRDDGVLDFGNSADGALIATLHDYRSERQSEIAELLGLLSIAHRPSEESAIVLPMRLATGAIWDEGVNIETPSVIEVIRAVTEGIEVPSDHLSEGYARTRPSLANPSIRIHSADTRPGDSAIAVAYRDHWFYIDASDATSKQSFLVLRTLVGMRLDDSSAPARGPTLTLPVGN
ncbi:MAG: hypothetical protein ACTS27_00750 [Phycisphaerales bacterium]